MPVVFQLLFWGFVLFWIFSHPRERHARANQMAQLAYRYRGRMLETGRLWKQQKVYFRHQGVPVRVYRGGPAGLEHDLRYTNIAIAWPDDPHSLLVCSKAFPSRLFPAMNVRDGFALPWFARRYQVISSDGRLPRRLLTPLVQQSFDRLTLIGSNPRLSLVGFDLVISLRLTPDDQQHLDRFVDAGLVLYHQLAVARGAGVVFLSSEATSPKADSACQVCGDPLVNDLVWCEQCQTPHHRQCWQYNGQCAIYGCGSQVAHPYRKAAG